MPAVEDPIALHNIPTTTTASNVADPSLSNPRGSLWESVEKLGQVDWRYAELLHRKQFVAEENHHFGTVKVFKLGQHTSGPSKGKTMIEETYNSKEPPPNFLGMNDLLVNRGSKVQILMHTFRSIYGQAGSQGYLFRKYFNLDLLVKLGEEFTIDPELLLMAGFDTSELETLPTRRDIFRMSIPSPVDIDLSIRSYELATQICQNTRDPTRYLVVILLAEGPRMSTESASGGKILSMFTHVYVHPGASFDRPAVLLAIGWARSFFLSVESTSSQPQGMEHLFTWFFTKMSVEDIAAAENDPRHIISGFVQVLLTFHLDDLHKYENSAAYARFTPKNSELQETNKENEENFERQLNLVQELEENARAFFAELEPTNLLQDIQFLRRRYERRDEILRTQASYDASMASLEESRIGIQQNASVKMLTQLAFVFIPLSFVTSVFGMNVDVLSGDGAKWWTVVIGSAVVYTIVGIGLVWLRFGKRILKYISNRKIERENRKYRERERIREAAFQHRP